jgi:hypothetical protein
MEKEGGIKAFFLAVEKRAHTPVTPRGGSNAKTANPSFLFALYRNF